MKHQIDSSLVNENLKKAVKSNVDMLQSLLMYM